MAALLLAGLVGALRPLVPGEGPENWFIGADKMFHLAYFALLWWLALRAGASAGWRLGLGLIVYGVVMEMAQELLTASRSASLADLLADSTGVALGFVLTRWAARRQPSAGQPSEHCR